MKRLAIAAAAALTLVGPLASTASAAEVSGRYDRDHRDGDRRDNDRADNRRGDDRRVDTRRWDQRRFNGYTYNGRWYWGQPSATHMRNAQYGAHQWRRGERVPQTYRGRFRQVDYRREHLRAPPRGYNYVRDDRGDTLLVAVATGVILSVILANQ